jgi:Uma2 family endonuclease
VLTFGLAEFDEAKTEVPEMSALRKAELISMEDFLQGESQSKLRHEFFGGQVFAMAGGTARHNRICTRTLIALEPLAAAQGCETFVTDMKLRVDDAIYYPDVMVVCDKSDVDPLIKSAPCLIIEVLSESTARIDRTEKLQAYQKISTLRNYLLIEQTARRIELFRRNGLTWRHESCVGDADIKLDCPNGVISLAQIYEGLTFSDVESP